MTSQPQLKTLTQTIACQGLTINTKNADEMNPETAKIGTLWQNFQSSFASQMTESTQVYGIYHNYESDMNGEFDVTACIAEPNNSNDSFNTLSIETGKYLVFRRQGEMPQAVIEAWGEVWKYFTADDCQYTRKYATDFEKYIGMDAVEIYISII